MESSSTNLLAATVEEIIKPQPDLQQTTLCYRAALCPTCSDPPRSDLCVMECIQCDMALECCPVPRKTLGVECGGRHDDEIMVCPRIDTKEIDACVRPCNKCCTGICNPEAPCCCAPCGSCPSCPKPCLPPYLRPRCPSSPPINRYPKVCPPCDPIRPRCPDLYPLCCAPFNPAVPPQICPPCCPVELCPECPEKCCLPPPPCCLPAGTPASCPPCPPPCCSIPSCPSPSCPPPSCCPPPCCPTPCGPPPCCPPC